MCGVQWQGQIFKSKPVDGGLYCSFVFQRSAKGRSEILSLLCPGKCLWHDVGCLQDHLTFPCKTNFDLIESELCRNPQLGFQRCTRIEAVNLFVKWREVRTRNILMSLFSIDLTGTRKDLKQNCILTTAESTGISSFLVCFVFSLCLKQIASWRSV